MARASAQGLGSDEDPYLRIRGSEEVYEGMQVTLRSQDLREVAGNQIPLDPGAGAQSRSQR